MSSRLMAPLITADTVLGDVSVWTYFQGSLLGYDFSFKTLPLSTKGDQVLANLHEMLKNEKKAVTEMQRRSRQFDPVSDNQMELKWAPAAGAVSLVLALKSRHRKNAVGQKSLFDAGVRPGGQWRLDVNSEHPSDCGCEESLAESALSTDAPSATAPPSQPPAMDKKAQVMIPLGEELAARSQAADFKMRLAEIAKIVAAKARALAPKIRILDVPLAELGLSEADVHQQEIWEALKAWSTEQKLSIWMKQSHGAGCEDKGPCGFGCHVSSLQWGW